MIDYYSELSHLAEVRKEKITNSIKSAAQLQIDMVAPIIDEPNTSKENLCQDTVNSSSESFYSAPDDHSNLPSEDEQEEQLKNAEPQSVPSSVSLDRLNGNFDTNPTLPAETSPPTVTQQTLDTIQQAVANFEFARRVKQKVLNQELGITATADFFQNHVKPRENITSDLTAAQRNKLKVLSTEFGINAIHTEIQKERVLTVAQINKNKVMGHSGFGSYETNLDNENYVNSNVQQLSVDTSESSIRKSKSLQLNLKPEPDKVVPMSVDSTPMSDLPLISTPMSVTPSSMMTSIETKTVNDDDNIQDIFSFTGTSKSSVASSFYQVSGNIVSCLIIQSVTEQRQVSSEL